jgi:hypothetical protein
MGGSPDRVGQVWARKQPLAAMRLLRGEDLETVSLNKQTNEREQTVRDTVRRTEVEEPEPSSRKPG